MKIQTFNNGRGLIYGNDPKRIGCDISGTLTIGTANIFIPHNAEAILPVLCNGCTGEYKATFTSDSGIVYELEKVTVRGGRILPPPQTAVEFMELRCRAEALEAECEDLREKIRELSNIFDTNSLNFLIN